MSEIIFNKKKDFKDLVNEAFIEPIRTVIVVDDEFPSLDGLIQERINQTTKPAIFLPKNLERVNGILSFCRERKLPWLVDIHDGKSVSLSDEEAIAPHYHHSDLMILDYHLEGNESNGDKAISILQKIAANNHFNLVIVYTNGYREQLSQQRIVTEIALGLSTIHLTPIKTEDVEKLTDIMEDWECLDEGITEKFLSEISSDMYLKLRNLQGKFSQILGLPEGAKIKYLLGTKPKEIKLNQGLFIDWIFNTWQEKNSDKFSLFNLGHVTYNFSEECSWVRTDKLFLTVVDKKFSEPAQLTDRLLDALCSWCPSPHHLLHSKIRSEIDIAGMIDESSIINNKFIMHGWLEDFIDKSVYDQIKLVKRTFNRHWDVLADRIKPKIEKYTMQLMKNLQNVSLEDLNKAFTKKTEMLNRNDVLKWINYYNSNKPFDRSHLTTGHIICLGSPAKSEFWICLSPACELVPGQKDSGYDGKIASFRAVKLHGVSDKTAVERSNENIFIFLETDKNISCFSITPNAEQKNNPIVEEMYCENHGMFSEFREIPIHRTVVDSGSLSFFSLKTNCETATVVGQLRYEYALNLLQRLGGSLSRIGLDFRTK